VIDEILREKLMQSLLGRGGNPRDVFRAMVKVKRNEIFWKLMNERTD
jgi:hypothetical protein